ncbi:MAG: GNAT family N-acetyltransferase [Alphaproteobacteria bacterium]|nr:GNAT family N-acetyltransferase [Alphaproteobacteria bacterium]
MEILIESTKKPKALEGINLYLNAGWGKEEDYIHSVDVFEKAYQNSFFITARYQNKLIGMIRFFTDGFHDTQIIECVVLDKFQKKGIGRNMLDKLKNLYPNNAIYIQATEKYQDFFIEEKFKKHALVGLSYVKKGNSFTVKEK